MGQAFNRLGTEVTIVDQADRILSRDDAEHADTLRQTCSKPRASAFVFGAEVERVEAAHPAAEGALAACACTSAEARPSKPTASSWPQAARRTSRTSGLDAAGVDVAKKGIVVDDRCRTSQNHIWAAGDCTGEYQLTHMSEHMAKVAITNAILKIPSSIDREARAVDHVHRPRTRPPRRQRGRAQGGRHELQGLPLPLFQGGPRRH